MGEAYLVEALATGTRCVLKAMSADLVKLSATREVFARYAKCTSKVASASILHTIDAGIDRATGRPWYTADLLRGEDLATRVSRKGARSESEVRFLLAGLAEALRKAHDQGLIHYDLTPENIHLEPGRPFALKVRELTISRLVSDALAAQGEIVGTAIWMAPEQFDLGRQLTPAANIWSLALLGFYVATGRPYWMNVSDTPLPSKALLREILASQIVSASQRAQALGCESTLPAWFDEWFARCLLREPEQRATATDAARAILAQGLPQQAHAAADDVVDDQATTLPLPDRAVRTKGSRSLPLGIVAEARGGAVVEPTASRARPTTEDGGRAKARRRVGWRNIALLFVAAPLLFWGLRNRLPRADDAVRPAKTAPREEQPTSPPVFAPSESDAAGGAAAASASADSDAATPAVPVAVRTFGAGDAVGGSADYDLPGALKVLNGVYYGNCSVPSAGKLAITFAANGHVKRIAVLRGDYDAATTECITARFGTAKVSPFRGGDQSVTANIVATR